MDIGNGFVHLFRKIGVFIGYTGSFETEPPGYHLHLAKHHFGMLYEVMVHFDAVLGGVELYPLRFDVDDPVPLLQDENVRYDLCSSVALKGVVRQTDSTKQIGSLSNILSDSGVFLIHRSLAGDERHYAARTELVQGFGEEVVVDEKLVLVVTLVRNLEIPEGDIPHNGIKEAVGEVGFLKALCGDRGLLI